MSSEFEFEYETKDKGTERRSVGRGGSRRRRGPGYWRRLPRWGKGTVIAGCVLLVSTIITSRDRGSDQLSGDEIAARLPTTETVPAPTATRPPTTTGPAVTQPAVVEPEPSPTRSPPTTTAIPASSTVPASPVVDWAELALSVVYIEAGDCPSFPSDMFSSGSGTVVLDGGHVLTNAHVVLDDEGRNCRDLVVWFTDSFEEAPSDWVRADLVAADRALDLAVLQLSTPVSSDRSITVTAQELEPGEAIRILGYPGVGGLTMTLTRGAYSGMVTHEGETYIKTDADMSEGSSGGAAFDESGILIGIPTGGIEEVGLLIPTGTAEKFLEQVFRS